MAVLAASAACGLFVGSEGSTVERASATDARFTIAVIPDTQNYIDYTHQTAEGFPFDAKTLFLEQMAYIAAHARSAGGADSGNIAFVTSVGDVWQHQTRLMDPEHEARGFTRASNAFWDPITAPSPKTLTEEIPTALRGYEMLDGRVPFSVVPGNHDYDAMWTHVERAPAASLNPRNAGALHTGGLSNFASAFSERSAFFKGKDWYVDAHDNGADSAQVIVAGGYTLLHIGLQFDAPNASLEWAASVIARHPGLPTIVSTHNYLDNDGGRTTDPIADNHATNPEANTPQMVWDKLISQHDQIFMVLCGHRGHASSIDRNRFGHAVYQLMSNYQARRQTAKAAGAPGQDGIGDGWMRLMTFDLSAASPVVRVRTYSTHYGKFSTDMSEYAAWYRAQEKPNLTDAEFHAQDDFSLQLTGFRARFGEPAR